MPKRKSQAKATKKNENNFDAKWAVQYLKGFALKEAHESFDRATDEYNFVFGNAYNVLSDQYLRIASTIDNARPGAIRAFLNFLNRNYPECGLDGTVYDVVNNFRIESADAFFSKFIGVGRKKLEQQRHDEQRGFERPRRRHVVSI